MNKYRERDTVLSIFLSKSDIGHTETQIMLQIQGRAGRNTHNVWGGNMRWRS